MKVRNCVRNVLVVVHKYVGVAMEKAAIMMVNYATFVKERVRISAEDVTAEVSNCCYFAGKCYSAKICISQFLQSKCRQKRRPLFSRYSSPQ